MSADSTWFLLGSVVRGAGEPHQFERRPDANLSQHSACAIGGASGCGNRTNLGEQHRQALGKIGVGGIDAHRSPDDVDRAIDLSCVVCGDSRAFYRGNDSNLDRVAVLRRPSFERQIRTEGTTIEIEDRIELFRACTASNRVELVQHLRRVERDELWMHRDNLRFVTYICSCLARGMTADDLRAKVKDLDDQLFRVRLQLSMGQNESAGKVKPLRRERARVKTVLREKGVKD